MFRRVGAVAIATIAVTMLAADAQAALCVRGVESWDTLRIRSAPTPQAREIGRIPPGACGVNVVGSCRGWWCPVAWRGSSGWSHSSYLTQPGPLAALGLPSWAASAPPRRVIRPASPGTARAERNRAPVKTAAVARPSRETVRTVAEGEAEPVPPAPQPAIAPQRTTLPPQAPVLVPSPQAAPTAPPPVDSALAVAAPPPAAAPATPPAASAREVCVIDVPKEDTLKVRAGPGTDQALRFGFPSGACGVKLTGPCKDGWCPVDYRGYRGWAEQKNLK